MKLIRNLSQNHTTTAHTHSNESCSEVSCDTVVPTTKPKTSNSSLQSASNANTPNRNGRIKLGISTYKTMRSSSFNLTQQQSQEIWIDGPKSINAKSPVHNILTPAESINFNEIWIDGPNAEPSSNSTPNSTLRKPQIKSKSNRNHLHDLNSNKKAPHFDLVKHHTPSLNSDSLECLDRALLRQLNEQDADIVDNFVFNLDSNSRPISLLSVSSNDNASIATNSSNTASLITSDELTPIESGLSYMKKLEGLKTSCDQMIFKQSYKPMDDLHKTLESFLSLDENSKFRMIPIKSDLFVDNIHNSTPVHLNQSRKI